MPESCSLRGSSLLAVCIAAMVAGCGAPKEGPPARVDSLSLPAQVEAFPVGREVRLPLTAKLSDGSVRRVNAEAQWRSSAEDVVAPIAGVAGTFRAVGEGEALLTAEWEGQRAQVTVTVAPPVVDALSFEDVRAELPLGACAQWRAVAEYSDGQSRDVTAQAAWFSSDEAVVSLLAPGELSARAQGASTLSAEFEGAHTSAGVVVSAAELVRLELSPPAPSLALGTTAELTAVAVFSDGAVQDVTAQAEWTSSSPDIAAVESGLATALAKGVSAIRAELSGLSAQVSLTVRDAELAELTVSPPVASAPRGAAVRLTATGTFTDGTLQDLTSSVAWTSTAPDTAAPGATPGVVLAKGAGQAYVEAEWAGVRGGAKVTVTQAELQSVVLTPGAPQVPRLATVQLAATGVYTDSSTVDLTSQVVWTSSAPQLATVSSTGLVTGVAEGTAVLTASFQGQQPQLVVTVLPPLLTGLTVTAPQASIAAGYEQPLTADATYADGSHQDVTQGVVWSTSAAQVAAVSNAPGSRGALTALTPGTAVITATAGTVAASFTVTVTPAQLTRIDLSPGSAQVPVGLKAQLYATGTFSDGTTQPLTQLAAWSSSASAVAFVASGAKGGEVTGLAQGSATVTASFNGLSASVTVQVLPPVITQLVVTPAQSSLAVGAALQLTASGTYSDGTQADVTALVQWTSLNSGLVAVSSSGVATAVAEGSATVLALKDGVRAGAQVQVTP